MSHAFGTQGPNRSRADIHRTRARCGLIDQALNWYGHERAEDLQRLRTGTPVIEHTEHSRNGNRTTGDLFEESLDRIEIQMTDDLCQVKLGAEALVAQEIDLLCCGGMRVGPAAEDQLRLVLANLVAQIPGVFDTAWPSDSLVAAQHHE